MNRVVLACWSAALLGLALERDACAGPFEAGKFKGRIAYSCDGNHNDRDDWVASPVALAIFAECGVKDLLVHFDYNCILPKTDPEWEKIHTASVLGAARLYGFDKSIFFDCQKDLAGAVASIARAIDESSADNPLYFILAGPMEVPFLGIQKSNPAKRKFVYCISHTAWNDGYSSKYTFTHNKRSVIPTGVHWVQVRDQNGLLSTSPYGRPARPEEFVDYFWMRDSGDPRVRFLWERMLVSTRPDPSDAGMAYFLLTGDEQADPTKLKRLLESHVVPSPVPFRSQVRLEAENFRELDGYAVEYGNRTSSHRLYVKPTNTGAGKIVTIFDEPFTALRGRYDVEIRYFDDKTSCQYALKVNGKDQGAHWNSPGAGGGWTSQTLRDVVIGAGDEITVVAGPGRGKIDYVQLNYRDSKAKTNSLRPLPPVQAGTLTLGVAQLALEADLRANCAKMICFIEQAKSKACRVVVFPESALSSAVQADRNQIDAAIAQLQKAAATHDVYVICCVKYRRTDEEKPFERLLVIGPAGNLLQSYDKLWGDRRFNKLPGPFTIDGVTCSATLCADRWLRSVEELPAMSGAQILFECSNNYAQEWIDDLGWYWYVPRALRNSAYVVFANTARENHAGAKPGHGHSAIIAPNGALLASAGEESDRLLVARVDLSKATRAEAKKRREHPLLSEFWNEGVRIGSGESVATPTADRLRAPKIRLKIAAAQMACSRAVSENVDRMKVLIRKASANKADIVVFPELAVTGALDSDVVAASKATLETALRDLAAEARAQGVAVVFGMPFDDGGKRYNGAFVVSDAGNLLTRYGQLVVDRPQLFAAGTSTRSLWFEIKGVPAIVTVGRDALWSELAELAAVRGAQVHLHLAYERDTSPAATLTRRQVWANLASFRTLTATVNAADPAALTRPSAPANGHSALWNDYQRGSLGRSAGFGPYSALRVAEAGEREEILYLSQEVREFNPHLERMTSITSLPMRPWYLARARAIASAEPTSDQPPTTGK